MKSTVMYTREESKRPKGWPEDVPYYFHFFSHPGAFTMIGGSPLPIIKVLVEEDPTRQLDEGVYFSWWDAEDGKFTHTYYNLGLLDMCFAYGPEIEEKNGGGRRFPVTVKAI